MSLTHSDDVVVAVLGASGTGKSTFIQTIIGNDPGISNRLEPSTTEIGIFRCSHPDQSGRKLVLIDSPGLDDADRSDTDIMDGIKAWLSLTYHGKVALSGVLFFLRISDNRIGEANDIKLLSIFRTLAGSADGSLAKVVLVTTMWDLVDLSIGQTREDALRTKYWEPMIRRGSSITRFLNTPQSGSDIIISLTGIQEVAASMQRESGREGSKLAMTSTNSPIPESLSRLAAQHWRLLEQLEGEGQSDSVIRETSEAGPQVVECDVEPAPETKEIKGRKKGFLGKVVARTLTLLRYVRSKG